MMNIKKNNFIFDSLSKSLPDDRPITALQIVESIDKCPAGFYAINKTYDRDEDADLWREGGTFLKRKQVRYLCLSKTEGLPNFMVHELSILNEKAIPPEGYSLLFRTTDSERKAWRKKQLCYKLGNRSRINSAITDIIVCSKLKKAPEGFELAGEINGVLICYKMGNVQELPSNPAKKKSSPTTNTRDVAMYPNLNEDDDGDYEILSPAPIPSRPAPPRPPNPIQHQNSTHNTLSSGHGGLEGVPFVLNPRFGNKNNEKLQLPVIKARNMSQLMRDYHYDFCIERQT